MQFDASLYLPQSQGGPNPEHVRFGSRLLKNALAEDIAFHEAQTDFATTGERQSGIYHYPAILANLAHHRALLERLAPRTLFTLGGDCSVDVAGIDRLHRCYPGTLGVVWIDAHTDVHTPESSHSGYFHGMPVRALLGEGDSAIISQLRAPLSTRQILYAGIRSIDPPEEAYIEERGVAALTAADINAGRYDAFDRWLAQSGIRHLHIHFDLDALDPADGISVTYPLPGGIRLGAARHFLQYMHAKDLTVGFTLTEYAPREENAREIAKILSLASVILPLREVLAA